MYCRGIRGATTVTENTIEQILKETEILLRQMINDNGIDIEDIASIFLSTTKDINAEFPAKAARSMGLNHTPLLCLHEMDVPGALDKCIRILIHVNTNIAQDHIQHIYLNEAQSLRPELAK